MIGLSYPSHARESSMPCMSSGCHCSGPYHELSAESPDQLLMHETWLQPNRRAFWFGCVPPLLLGAHRSLAGRLHPAIARSLGGAQLALSMILSDSHWRRRC